MIEMSGSTPVSGKGPEGRCRMWSAPVLAKYWALQLPGAVLAAVVLLGIADHLAWPQSIVWTLVALWVATDAILYPFLWRAYYPSDPAALPYPVEGAQAVAIDRIDPSGHVRVWGELWRAQLARRTRGIEKGERVQVKARHGLTLFIEAREASGAG